MTEPEPDEITAGQAWRRKGDPGREVYVTDVDAVHVYVTRNTSRRRQAIARTTLLRRYYRVPTAKQEALR
jgi:hypothetical protein